MSKRKGNDAPLSKTARASLAQKGQRTKVEHVEVVSYYEKPSGAMGLRRHVERRETAL